jgi:MFS family permease
MASIALDPRTDVTLRSIVREVAVTGIAGLIVGVLVGGLGSRLFMRLAGAVAPDSVPGARIGEITLGGSLALVVFVGIPTGIVGAALAVIAFPWLAWAGRWRGIVFGVVLFALASASSDVMNPDNVDFLLIRNGWLMVAAILALFVAFGAAMDAVVRALDRRLPTVERAGTGTMVTYGAVATVGIALVGLLAPLALFTRNFCQCDPPLLASAGMFVAGIGTVLRWIARSRPDASLATTVAPMLGYGGIVAVVVFGLFRVVADASDIVVR